MALEVKMEVWRITRRSKEGETMETELVEEVWVPMGSALSGANYGGDPDLILAPTSTANFQTRRTRS